MQYLVRLALLGTTKNPRKKTGEIYLEETYRFFIL
jgi:hypothetical protein